MVTQGQQPPRWFRLTWSIAAAVMFALGVAAQIVLATALIRNTKVDLLSAILGLVLLAIGLALFKQSRRPWGRRRQE